MKLLSSKLALFLLGLLVLAVLSYLCATGGRVASDTGDEPIAIKTKQPETKPATMQQRPKQQPAVKAPAGPSNIVAKIGEYVITREELEKRLMSELLPDDYDEYSVEAEPVDAKMVLMKMIAEKAMVMEAREQDFLEDETIKASIKRFRERKLVGLLLQRHLQNKLTVTESEIEEKLKTNPKLDRTRAKVMLERTKANRLLEEYYSQIYKKFHVRKLSDNFSKAAQIHQRLLYHPKKPRRMGFIRVDQIKNELTLEEKSIVLAAYDKGKVTLKDWFDTLSDIAPPSRPRDLNTPKGVEKLLDRTLKMPLFVSEAELLGLDKDENLLKQIREQEDRRLLDKVRREKVKDIKEPTGEQIVAYFNKNKETFGTGKTVKIDQIWCQDLKTAQKVKAELDGGKDFEPVRQQYSLEKKGNPFNTYPGSEGVFFEDLWEGDPNSIVGPVKGFYRDGVKWRIVKILEKKPGEVKEYSNDMENRVKGRMLDEQREAVLGKYRRELLEKYSYEIYAERIRDIDPLDIP